MQSPFHILHLTDIHLQADPQAEQSERNIADSHTALLQLALQQEQTPDLLVVTGDLADAGNAQEFRACYNRLAQEWLTLGIPRILAFGGNHDEADIVAEVFEQFGIDHQGPIELDQWQLSVLDTVRSGQAQGYLKGASIDAYLEQLAVSEAPFRLTLMHHPLINLADGYEENQSVSNPESLWQPLKTAFGKSSHIQKIHFLSGHAHREFELHDQLNDDIPTHFLGTPAACPIQYQSVEGQYAVDPEHQTGFRWLTLYPDGRLATRVIRLNQEQN